MPKKTFYNLKGTKREKIVDAAMDEFSTYTFNDASVNRIIKQSGIAVGSFYQYFDDLRDLYYYVLRLAMESKYEYLKTEIDLLHSRDFISTIRALYRGGVKFAFSDKRLFDISNNLIKSNDLDIIKELTDSDGHTEIVEFVNRLIKEAIDNGKIRNDIDSKLIVSIIMGLNNFIEHMFYVKPEGLNGDDYNMISDKVIDLLMNGIGIKETKND